MHKLQPVLLSRLFPKVAGPWGEIHVAGLAAEFSALSGRGGENPFLTAAYFERWLRFVHRVMEVQYSWGGYMEDRSALWAGSYLKPGHAIHLGVDFHVPAGSVVHLPTPAKLVNRFVDPDQEGGWGGRLVFQWLHGYFVLGHLCEMVGDLDRTYGAMEPVGSVAEPERNGGWSPHLHLHCMNALRPDADGYAARYHGIEFDYPDPINAAW